MAKVKTVCRINPPSFFVNDASLTELVRYDVIEESSSDVDISQLLNDNEASLKKQYSDNDNLKNEVDSKPPHNSLYQAIIVPSSSANNAVNSTMSLGTLAKHHLEKDKTLNEWSFDGDFDLSDILHKDDFHSSIISGKNTDSCNHLSLFDICLNTEDNLKNKKLNTTSENDIYDEDLSELGSLGSVLDTNSTSLNSLATSHLLNNDLENNRDKKFSNSCVLNLKNDADIFKSFDCFDNILSENQQESIDNFTENDTSSVLSDHHSTDSSETSEEKHSSTDETSDELVPDIDLSFCIKKNVSDKFSTDTSSSESVDSGFSESDLTSIGYINSILNPDVYPCGKENLLRAKQSLLSRAISARPKIDDTKRAKLKKVRCELLKNHFPSCVFDSNQKKQSHVYQNLIDQSSECVIISSFLTVSDQGFQF